MTEPVSTRILDAMEQRLRSVFTGARSIDVDRDNEAEPYQADELPAINLIPVDEELQLDSFVGAALGVPMLQDVALAVVLQIVTRGGTQPAREARRISAACELALSTDPTLGGVCTQVLRVTGRQWLRDDGAEQRLSRMNTRLVCGYRTQSTDPYSPI